MLITASEIIKKSWETYSQNWKKFIPYVVAIFASSTFLVLVGFVSFKIEEIISKESLLFINNIFTALVSVAVIVFTLWISIALTKNLYNAILNKEIVGLKDSLSQNSKYLWPVIWSSFLMFLAVVGGLFLLIIPALIFAIWFTYTFYVVIFEDVKGITALKNSKKMVSGRWWKTLWLILAPTIFYGVLFYVVQNILYLPLTIFLTKGSWIYLLYKSLSVNIISAFFTPLSALPMIYLYFSAKENPASQPLPPPVEVK